ncbi:MAG: hypothetical protein G3M70_07155 [Candidatus Nitronauta litoralis]|uniref:ASCH domain-containing protein n=1 Tax=Candidatus Nitronauta litoralis TaxID=2705533 RepID=A0A7T0BVE8_9BACT|nr:MAG: hypothetical protein G3M70_07155 [Candidatus Nitronauta litoralis]
MLNISFGYTWHAVVMDAKTCTLRDWKDSHAKKFIKGSLVAGLTKGYFANGKKFGIVQVKDCYRVNTSELADEDYVNEGFEFYDRYPFLIPPCSPFAKFENQQQAFDDWREQELDMWRLDFNVFEIEPSILVEVIEMTRKGGLLK